MANRNFVHFDDVGTILEIPAEIYPPLPTLCTYLIEKHFALQFQETKEWFDRMKSERTSPSRLALTSQEERQRFFDETRERILQR